MAAKAKRRKGKEPPPQPEWPHVSVSEHPSAARSVRRGKAWAGLVAFVAVAWFSSAAGVTAFEVGVRALLAGVAAYVIAWFALLALWQRLVLAEAKHEAIRRRDARLALERSWREAQERADAEAAA